MANWKRRTEENRSITICHNVFFDATTSEHQSQNIVASILSSLTSKMKNELHPFSIFILWLWAAEMFFQAGIMKPIRPSWDSWSTCFISHSSEWTDNTWLFVITMHICEATSQFPNSQDFCRWQSLRHVLGFSDHFCWWILLYLSVVFASRCPRRNCWAEGCLDYRSRLRPLLEKWKKMGGWKILSGEGLTRADTANSIWIQHIWY